MKNALKQILTLAQCVDLIGDGRGSSMSLDEIQENKCVQKLKDQQHGVSMCDMKFYLNRAKLASAMDNLRLRGVIVDEIKRDRDRTKRKNRKRGNDESLQKLATKKVQSILGLASKTLVLETKWKSCFSHNGYVQYIRNCEVERQKRYEFFLLHADFNLASPRRKTPSNLVLAKIIDIVAQLKKDKVAKAKLEEAKRTLMEVARLKTFDSKWRSTMHSPLQSEKVSYGSKSQTYAEILHLVLTKERHDHTNSSVAFTSAIREASARSFGGDILDGIETNNRILVLDFMGDMIATPRGTTFRDWITDFYRRIVLYRKKTRAKIVICILDTAAYDSILRLLVEQYRNKQQNHDSSVEFDFDIDDDVSNLHKSYKECHRNYKTTFRPMLSRMFREGMKDLTKFPLILIGGHREKGRTDVRNVCNVGSSDSKKRFEYERQRVNSTIKTYGQYTNSPMKIFGVKRVSQGQGCIFDAMIIPDDLHYDDNVTYDQLLLSLRDSRHRKDECRLILLLVEHLIKHSSKKDVDESKADFENDDDGSDDESLTDDETELVSEEADDDLVSNLEVDGDIVGVSGDGDDTTGDSAAATPASRMDVDTPAVGNKRSLRPLGTNQGTATNPRSANPRSRKEPKLSSPRRGEAENLTRRFNNAAEK